MTMKTISLKILYFIKFYNNIKKLPPKILQIKKNRADVITSFGFSKLEEYFFNFDIKVCAWKNYCRQYHNIDHTMEDKAFMKYKEIH